MTPLQQEQTERLAQIVAGNYFDNTCGRCYCDASPASLRACAERMLKLATESEKQRAANTGVSDGR